jgi:hypothetical protein
MAILPRFRRHSCPMCAHHVGYRRLYTSRKWQCRSCQAWLTIDHSSALLVGFCCAVWGTFLIFKLHDPLWAALLLFTLGALIFTQFLSVSVVENAPSPKNQPQPRETPKT